MSFINDFSLMGFWPLNEPSGSPLFYNYSAAPIDTNNVGRTSGIQHHMHVTTTNADSIEPRAFFPHTQSVNEAISGTIYTGFNCYGTYDRSPDNDGPYEKALVCGISSPSEGLRGTKMGVSIPQVAQSGFTVGLWVLPNSDGFVDISNLAAPRTNSSPAHSLVAQGVSSQGFCIGVSGFLKNDARGSEFVEGGGNRQLRAYGHYWGSSDSTSVLLDTPIESGTYTHIAVSYRFNDTNDNQWVLYKNGRVEGSGVSSFELTETGASSFSDCPLLIGGVAATPGQRPEWATGFGNMVSGVYAFRRVLDEGEVLELHNAGGLQPGDSTFSIPEAKEITIDDPKLIGYYPFINPGYADASKNRMPLIAATDEGVEGVFIPYTGPFGKGGVLNDGSSNPTTALAAGSGTMDLFRSHSNAGGFTISLWAEPDSGLTFQRNILCSLGGAGGTSITPSLDGHYAGFIIAVDDENGSNSVRTKVAIYNGGNPNDATILREAGTDQIPHALQNITFVYDRVDQGASLYIDGEFQASGHVPGFNQNITRLVGSGFPLCFLGGVDETSPEDFVINGGQNSAVSQMLVMGRPLAANEIRFLAQSGIDLSKNYYTPNDPRLRFYWPCTDSLSNNPVIARDKARVWNRAPIPLVRASPELKWTHVLQDNDTTGPFLRTDLFGEDGRPTPTALDSEGNLGITSGIWAANGSSFGIHQFNSANENKNSLGALPVRYRFSTSQRDLVSPFFNDAFIFSFEVTPSGAIPDSDWVDGREFNSVLTSYSNGFTSIVRDQFVSYLTTINANGPDPVGADLGLGASGVCVVFAGVDGNPSLNASKQLISGVLDYATPSRVTLHCKPLTPHTFTETNGDSRIQLDLYINGSKVNSVEETTQAARIWPDSAAGSNTDDFVFEIGGYATDDSNNQAIDDREGGLGENYIRNIFMARGDFSNHDIGFFSQSGVARSSTLNGFNDQQSTSIVRVTDPRLQGYYRFTGGPGGSGTRDLSSLGNHLSNLAGEAIDSGISIGSDSYAFNRRFVPGPLKYSRLTDSIGVEIGQASGITLFGNPPGLDSNTIPAFAVSGTNFSDPENGFSIGFWYASRNDLGSNAFRVIASYGITPPSSTSTADQDSVWAIVVDDLENIKLMMSKDGVMYVDPAVNAAKSSTIECGLSSTVIPTYKYNNSVEKQRHGFFSPSHSDSWQHLAWTYKQSTGIVKCFLNGQLVDQVSFSTNGVNDTLNVPTDPTTRILSLLCGMDDVWNWDVTSFDDDGVLTDLFYFNDALEDDEVLFIAENGIAETDVTNPSLSGIVGGHVYASDIATGVVGSWVRGFDNMSGIIGSWLEASLASSGVVGGFVSGIPVPISSGIIGGFISGISDSSRDGLIGGYLRGSQLASGLYGGFVFGTDNVSGVVGGWINGGLSGTVEFDGFFVTEAFSAEDFDSMVEIMRTSTSDFDAKVEIFQAECPPEVNIITPVGTVSGQAPPFNQYFVATASGVQGKTIEKTRWSFGDFTGFTNGSVSGAHHYPIQHRFDGLGFYIVKFEAIDSNGMIGSDTIFVHAASGVDPVRIALSGMPQVGETELTVQYDQTVETIPNGVAIVNELLDLGNGQTTSLMNPKVVYTEPGLYRPIWCIRDTRGIIFCDSLDPGIDIDKAEDESGI